jgi:hypothetical protein
MCAAILPICFAACSGGGNRTEAPAASPAATPPAASASSATAATADDPCPLTLEQVAAITGTPMVLPGACTFFPANGRDIPHVFYVLQNPMVCTSIQPVDLGFTETIEGLAARAAYAADRIDGAHVLVCPNGNARAFDIVVEIRNEKPKNREAAIALAKQVLADR